MNAYVIIAWNSFREVLRQPAFLVLVTGMLGVVGLLANVSYFGFGEEPRLVKTSALSILLLAGFMNAILSASSSVAQEIRSGTALSLLAKPVGRTGFLLAKFLGLGSALAVQTYVGIIATLMASRMAFDAHGSLDWPVIGIFLGGILLAYLGGAATNYFANRQFPADVSFALVGSMTLALLAVGLLDRFGAVPSSGLGVDWRLLPAGVLVWLAVLLLAALAIACNTRLTLMPTLIICSGLFALGLLSDYLFGAAARGGSWMATALHTVLPNWQLFWMADRLGGGEVIPWSYVTRACGYTAAYLTATLAVAGILFEDRDLT